MADVELVIKMPEEEYELCRKYDGHLGDHKAISCAIANGIPLPKGHGRLIDVDELELDTEWDFAENEFISVSQMQIDRANTIVPADTESEEHK